MAHWKHMAFLKMALREFLIGIAKVETKVLVNLTELVLCARQICLASH